MARGWLAILVVAGLAGCFGGPPDAREAAASTSSAVASPTTDHPARPPPGCRGESKPGGFEDWAVQRFWVNVSGAGLVTVGLALWESEGVAAGDWTQGLQGSGGLRGWQLADDLEDPWLEVSGEDGFRLEGCLARGSSWCCDEDYIYGRWSTGPERPPGERGPMPVRTDAAVNVEYVYQAASSYCGGRLEAVGPAGPGDDALPVTGGFWCT